MQCGEERKNPRAGTTRVHLPPHGDSALHIGSIEMVRELSKLHVFHVYVEYSFEYALEDTVSGECSSYKLKLK